jgi:asparagine synthase (glutamine-hydrolysing)
MCGIAGIAFNRLETGLETSVSRMVATLAHRGPDDEGIWTDNEAGIGLGHRRLSIIDLSPQGHQPMTSPSGRYVMSYNGEFYNFPHLRDELERCGKAPAWRGHSDTEIFLAAVDAWGLEEALRKVSGMFAIAIWDRQNRSLSLVRDRIGEKPLYYGKIGQGLAFGSELKALRALSEEELRIDPRALAEFMRFGYVPSPMSIYRDVRKLRPGHIVVLRSADDLDRQQSYWSLDSERQADCSEQYAKADDEELIGLAHDKLSAVIGMQMISDVPLGAFLSGGVDSSTVVALMQSQSAKRVRTFTIGFNESGFDEAPYAKAVAEHLGTEHTELYVNASDAANIIPQIPTIYDEPFADSSQIPTTLVSQLTRNHVTVSLSGDGGDELFAGYPRYALTEALWNRVGGKSLLLRRALSRSLNSLSPQTWDTLLGFLPARQRQRINGRRLHRLAQMILSENIGEMYVGLMSQFSPEDGLVVECRESNSIDWPQDSAQIGAMRRWDVGQYLPDDLLVKVDRAAMSVGLESRAPLLDHGIVEFAFALPQRVLVRDGVGKWILRRVLDRYVPRALIDRPKAGFAIPIAEWLRGDLREWAEALLCPVRIKRENLLDASQVSQIWNEHLSGKFDRSTYLWNILMFQAWGEKINNLSSDRSSS